MAAHLCPSCGAPIGSLTLTYREAAEMIGISLRHFYDLKAQGHFQQCETQIPHRLSREKVEAYCANRPVRPYAKARR